MLPSPEMLHMKTMRPALHLHEILRCLECLGLPRKDELKQVSRLPSSRKGLGPRPARLTCGSAARFAKKDSMRLLLFASADATTANDSSRRQQTARHYYGKVGGDASEEDFVTNLVGVSIPRPSQQQRTAPVSASFLASWLQGGKSVSDDC